MRIAPGIPNTIRTTEGHLFPLWANVRDYYGFGGDKLGLST